ncbi:MAG: hypothetical protein AAF694_02600 [Bacteroidota bacterium]
MLTKTNISWSLLLVGSLTFFLAIFPAFEGYPFIVHWDEELVFRRPFRRAFQYLSGDFSSPTNLFDVLLLVWYTLGYVLGRMLGLWADFNGFRDQLILESGALLVWGRMLAVGYITIGNCLIHRFFSMLTSKQSKALLASLCIVFNPFLYPSLVLIKFDALVYLFTCILLINSFKYFKYKQSDHRLRVYFWGFLSLSLRVELLLFIGITAAFDTWEWSRSRLQHPIRPLLKPITWGLGLSLAFTLYPVSFLYRKLYPNQTLGLASKMSYGENIVDRILSNFQDPTFLETIWQALTFYGELLLSSLGPFILILFVVSIFKQPQSRGYLIHLGAFGCILGVFGVRLVHYAVTPSMILLFIGLQYSLQGNSKWKTVLQVATFLYVSTLTVHYMFLLHSTKAPAVQTHSFLLNQTTPKDLIAIETLSGAAFHPHLTECRALEKIEVAKQVSPYGGSELEILLRADAINPCRKQIDICEINYLDKNPDLSNEFVNTYDTSQLETLKPKWFVTTHPLNPKYPTTPKMKSFFAYIKSGYEADTLFGEHTGIIDPRVKKINIRRTFYIYRRKDS